MNTIITKTDSYKMGCHFNLYPKGTEYVYSYFEGRNGGYFPDVLYFGLQYFLKKYFVGKVVTQEAINQAEKLAFAHFGNHNSFNKAGWQYILDKHNGKLPLAINAVPEGSVIPLSNVLMTVVNTDPKCYWLTNYVESILTHIWYPCAVATLSYNAKQVIKKHLLKSADNLNGLDFMLHDFGYRSANTDEAAEIGGLSHLLNFKGTDTIPALVCAIDYYNANPDFSDIAFSVPATEHSIKTALGKEREPEIIQDLLNKYPDGSISDVGDSYDICHYVSEYICKTFKKQILSRNGVFVVRPDSITPKYPTKEAITLWIVKTLYEGLGGYINSKGYKVIDKHCRALYGDGLNIAAIDTILETLEANGYSSENIATFGMGGGLLHKDVNRDLLRFAFKSCAQMRNGVWYDIFKNPSDTSKASKKGLLKLIHIYGQGFRTVNQKDDGKDILVNKFLNGKLMFEENFADIRRLVRS